MYPKISLQDCSLKCFMKMPVKEKLTFINGVQLDTLHNNDPLVKKYITMKILAEAANVNHKNRYHLTHWFRSSFFSSQIHVDKQLNGYRIWHPDEIGLFSWKQRHLYITVGDDFSVNTTALTRKYDGYTGFTGLFEEHYDTIGRVDKHLTNLRDTNSLRFIFNQLDEYSNYRNSFGFDLFQTAMFCGTVLFEFSTRLSLLSIAAIPLALALNVAIYATVIPISLTLAAIENFLISPIVQVVNALQLNNADGFIHAVEGLEAHCP